MHVCSDRVIHKLSQISQDPVWNVEGVVVVVQWVTPQIGAHCTFIPK
jgi:hypothetical protein